jgi:hypothetical protein
MIRCLLRRFWIRNTIHIQKTKRIKSIVICGQQLCYRPRKQKKCEWRNAHSQRNYNQLDVQNSSISDIIINISWVRQSSFTGATQVKICATTVGRNHGV